MKKLIFILCTLSAVQSFAQQPLRVEIEPKRHSEDYRVIPLGRDGVLFFYETDEKAKDGNKLWQFTEYDSTFKEVWSKEFPVNKKFDFIKSYQDSNTLYILVGIKKYRQMFWLNQGEAQILAINYKDGKITSTNTMVKEMASISDFKVMDKTAYLTGFTLPSGGDVMCQMCLTITCIPWITGLVVFKFHPIIKTVELGSGKTTTIDAKQWKGNTFVIGNDLNTTDKTLMTVVKNKLNKKECFLYLNEYKPNGQQKSSNKIDPKGDYELISAKVMNLPEKEQVLMGTYKKAVQTKKSFNPAGNLSTGLSDASEGMYFSKLKNGKQTYIKYYDFNKFSNFYVMVNKYASKSRQKKTMDKAKEKVESGKTDLKYQLLIHDIIVRSDQYILVGEAYYAQYHTEYRTSTDANGRMTTQAVQVFDGWRYTHAIVAGFDKSGNKVWDGGFEINDILSMDLKERVKVLNNGEDVVLVYNYNGKVNSKIVNGTSMTDGKTSADIETNYDKDKVKDNWGSDIDFWYDNYMIAYGYSKIKNTDSKAKPKSTKNRRTVFYFNKIAYQ